MSHTHLKQSVIDLKEKIRKTLVNLETDQEMMLDVLKALEPLELDVNLITTTGIGSTLRDVIKQSREKKVDAVTDKASKILNAWRGKAAVPSTRPAVAPSSYPDNESRKMALSSGRSATVKIITQQLLKKSNDAAKVEHWALNIEEAVNHAHSFDTEKLKYTEKIRSLSFNLTKNEELLNMVMDGQLPCDKLVHSSPAELASQKVKAERERIANEEVLSRRLDQEEKYRKEIHADLGIDDSDAWQYDQDDDAKSEPDMEAPDS